MIVKFRKKKLERQFLKVKVAEKAYGKPLARRYIERINIIQRTNDIKELQNMPALHCHPLKGNRSGHWAITVKDRTRLIFTLQIGFTSIVTIEEVTEHYGD